MILYKGSRAVAYCCLKRDSAKEESVTDCVDLMMQEHEQILRLTGIFRSACREILAGNAPVDGDFRDMITLARTYADRHHHGKEEQILFREMEDQMGAVAINLIQHGMLVEHDLGRFHLRELETALDQYAREGGADNVLDILTHASGWADLLRRHIDRENDAVYLYARRELPADRLREIDRRVAAFEKAAADAGIQQTALAAIDRLEDRYKGGDTHESTCD